MECSKCAPWSPSTRLVSLFHSSTPFFTVSFFNSISYQSHILSLMNTSFSFSSHQARFSHELSIKPFYHSHTLDPPSSHPFFTPGPILSRIKYRRMGRLTSSSSGRAHSFLRCAVCRCVDSIVLSQSTCTARSIVLFLLDTSGK